MKYNLISRLRKGGIIPEKIGEIYCDPDTLVHEKVAAFIESLDLRYEVVASEIEEAELPASDNKDMDEIPDEIIQFGVRYIRHAEFEEFGSINLNNIDPGGECKNG